MPDWLIIVLTTLGAWIALSLVLAVCWARAATNLKRRHGR
jgi:hypothetical protein